MKLQEKARRAAFSSSGSALLAAPTIRNGQAWVMTASQIRCAADEVRPNTAWNSAGWQSAGKMERNYAYEYRAQLAQRFDVFDHAFSLLRIGHPPKACAKIIEHVLRFISSWNDRGDRRVTENEFQEELAPAFAVEFRGPIRQLLAQGGAEKPPSAER